MSEQAQSETNYYAIFALLVIALVLSLVLGYLSRHPLAITAVFGVAAVKAYVVLTYFIHLKAEPRFVKVLVAGVLIVLAVLYIGLLPDIVWVYGSEGAGGAGGAHP